MMTVAAIDRLVGRSRNANHLAPPAQIRTCATNAYGSYFGYLTKNLSFG